MEISTITWAGLGLCVLAASALSLFHITLSGYSKVGLSGFLEERNHPDRTRILDRYDDIKIAVEFWRMILIIALAVYAFLIFPAFRTRPLGLFLFSAVVYAVFFDIVPRLLAAAGRDRCLSRFLPSYRLFLSLSAPVLAFVRWLSVREEQKEEEAGPEDREAGEEEIETFLDEAEEEGIIEKGEDALLRNVVEFGDTIVREVMTPRVDMVCIRRDATIQKLRHLFIVEKYSRIPVYRDRIDGVDGLVMAKDLLAYSEKEFDEASIEPLVRPLLFVPESMKVADLLKELQKAKQKLAVVVDEHGGVSGLVTMEDVFEVIVGEIRTNTTPRRPRSSARTDYTVSGAAKVENRGSFRRGAGRRRLHHRQRAGGPGARPPADQGERLIIGRLIVDVLTSTRRIKLRMRKAADEGEHAG